jgi:hypothetical protein
LEEPQALEFQRACPLMIAAEACDIGKAVDDIVT